MRILLALLLLSCTSAWANPYWDNYPSCAGKEGAALDQCITDLAPERAKEAADYKQQIDANTAEEIRQSEAEDRVFQQNIQAQNNAFDRQERAKNIGRSLLYGLAVGAQGYSRAMQQNAASQRTNTMNCTTNYIGNQAYTNCN